LTKPLLWLAVLATLELGGILLGVAGFTAIDAAPELPLARVMPDVPKTSIFMKPASARLDAILQRPLFTAGRTPFQPERARAAEPASLPRLSGLVITENQREAIFAAASGQKPLVVHEGDRMGTFTVTAIRAREVELAGPLGARTLRPSADTGLRPQIAYKMPVLAMIAPVRRERETESDQ